MKSPVGEPTNNRKKREKSFKTLPQTMEGYTMVKIDGLVPTWVKRKIKID
jgi:hypothetical protein